MVAAQVRLHQTQNRIIVTHGESIDRTSCDKLSKPLFHILTSVTARKVELLFDLSEVRSFDVDARKQLVELQKAIASSVSRTVYLAIRPHIRGLALWIIHCAGDQNACVVMSPEEAESWLKGTRGRLETWEQRTEEKFASFSAATSAAGGRP